MGAEQPLPEASGSNDQPPLNPVQHHSEVSQPLLTGLLLGLNGMGSSPSCGLRVTGLGSWAPGGGG